MRNTVVKYIMIDVRIRKECYGSVKATKGDIKTAGEDQGDDGRYTKYLRVARQRTHIVWSNVIMLDPAMGIIYLIIYFCGLESLQSILYLPTRPPNKTTPLLRHFSNTDLQNIRSWCTAT